MLNRFFKITLVSSFVALTSLTACKKETDSSNDVKEAKVLEATKIHGKTMGTFYAVNVVGGFEGGEKALTELCEGIFKEICDRISTFDKNAELARFNDFKSTEPFEISNELGILIQECVYQSRRIEGAMDISVGPLVNLWGFGKDRRLERAPTQADIDERKKLVGLDKFELRTTKDKSYLVKHHADVRLDMATVGEGIGADMVAEALVKRGYRNFMVNVAGASRSLGLNEKGRKWRIGIEDPTSMAPKVIVPVCPLNDAVTTAGSYRNFFKDENTGKVYSHAIDPKTGYPVSHSTLSVTVISHSAFESDALDTGLLVLGADRALKFGEDNNMAIATIEYVDGKVQFRHTKAFERYLECK